MILVSIGNDPQLGQFGRIILGGASDDLRRIGNFRPSPLASDPG